MSRVAPGEELFFDYGRAYWKKAYFFANSFAQPTEDAVAESSPVSNDGAGTADATAAPVPHASSSSVAASASQIGRVLKRLREDPQLRRCCYRVAPVRA